MRDPHTTVLPGLLSHPAAAPAAPIGIPGGRWRLERSESPLGGDWESGEEHFSALLPPASCESRAHPVPPARSPVCRDQRKPLPFPWSGHKPECLNHAGIKIDFSSRNRNAGCARHRLRLAPGPHPGVTPALPSAERKQLLGNGPVRAAPGCPFSPGCRRQATPGTAGTVDSCRFPHLVLGRRNCRPYRRDRWALTWAPPAPGEKGPSGVTPSKLNRDRT